MRKKLTRTKCASEKELINTQGAASLDPPSYQGEPVIGPGMARTCGGKEGRTDGRVPRACGAGREKAASFLCYFGSGGGGVHFNAIAEEKHAEWQLATKYIAASEAGEDEE